VAGARPAPSPPLRDLNELNFARFDAKLEQRVAELRQEMAATRGELKAEFHRELGSAKAELIKWMFVFWTPTVLALMGLYFKG